MSLRQQSLENSAIRQFNGSSIELIAQVVTDPTRSARKVYGSTFAPQNYTFLARAIHVEGELGKFDLRIPIRIITQDSHSYSLLPGQSFSARARVIRSDEARVAVLALLEGAITVLTPASRVARTLGSIRTGLREISGDGDSGALIPGMVLGDTSKQSAQFKESMKRSGLTHLVAVSGANFAIVSGFVLWLMQFLVRKLRWRLGATALTLIAFIALVRPSPSVLRAAAMAAVLLLAQGSGRARDSLPALGFAMGAVVIADPWQSRDAGFALSVMATAGLLLFAPKIVTFFTRYVPKLFAEALAPPIAATLFCSPILVALSGYISPISVVANLLAAPVVAPITILGFIAALLAPIVPFVSAILISIIRYPAAFIGAVAEWASHFPVLSLGVGTQGFVRIILIIAIAISMRIFLQPIFRKVILFFLILLLAMTWIHRFPSGDWQVAQCDVGQGDSLVLNLGSHRAIVIDVGPDSAAEDRCLRQLGIEEISLLILTHFHADHVQGLEGAMNGRKIDQVWVSTNSQPLSESTRVDELIGDIPKITVHQGMRTVIQGDISISILWPEISMRAFDSLPGDGSAINNSSIALLIETSDYSLFAAGDIEPPVQIQIAPLLRPVDIYKVSHHGSKYQDETLMKILKPQVAIISVGAGNSYGHPALSTMAALRQGGARVVRTDRDGVIALTAREHNISIRTSKSGLDLFR
jgi:competence protein ComEC